jgi:3-oxoacyl-(acyl-carrier-protein) synthase/surfactin synthase thioesterase subunit/aryl carrier-like protein
VSGAAVKEALVEIRRLRALLAAREPAPVAVIGLACRFPGAPDASAFRRLLMAGEGAVAPPGGHRAAAHRAALDAAEPALRPALAEAGYLDEIAGFDAGFFGISPREALLMDPQHRLALETAWTALEDAGQDPAGFSGQALGVFLGISANDYGQNVLGAAGQQDAHALTGGGFSFAAGRIARLLGATGPAMALDTACSSSLVAVHLAARALQAGECAVALAGGVNLICSLAGTAVAARAGMLSPSARCRPFAAAADGFVRAEGVGFVVLKPLPAALAAGDRVLAVLAGSAMGQDGPTAGLTVPSPSGQAEVVRRALAAANLPPGRVAAVETHGTGTRLGDPIEASGLAEVFGGRDTKLLLGALKGNIGHAESAAGIAGLIKAVQALEAGVLPPNRDHGPPNPLIGWDRLPFALPRAATPLPPEGAIGVSSFGASGTNAHVVLLPPPAMAPREGPPPRGRHLLLLSARTEAALAETLALQAAALRTSGAEAADIAFTLNTGRAALPHRVAVTGRDAAELAAALPGAMPALAGAPPRIGLLCPPRGGYPARLHPSLAGAAPGPVGSLLAAGRFWRELGVAPLLVAGCGAGEIAAAALAGCLEDAAALALGARALAGEDAAGLLDAAPRRPAVARLVPLRAAAGLAALSGLDVLLALGPVPFALRRALPEGVTLLAPRSEGGLLEAVGALWRRGVRLNRAAMDAPWPRRRVALPTTPFARTPFWPEAAPALPIPAAPRPPATGLRALAAEVLGIAPDALEEGMPLRDLGLDSMLAMELEERAAAQGEAVDLAALLGGASLAELARGRPAGGWLVPLGTPPARPRARLLVIGHAGAGPGVLRGWADALGSEVEILAAALPGRDARLAEPPPATLEQAAEGLAQALAALPPAPLLVLGHSFGAWLGWAVARRLAALGRAPEALVPVAFGPPDAPAPQAALAARLAVLPEEITPEALEAALRELGVGATEGAPRLAGAGWRGLRADLGMLAAHAPAPAAPLPGRILAIAATTDAPHPPALLQGWARLAGGGFTLRAVPGDHLAAAAPTTLRGPLRDLIEETCPP